jgi:hypothetical protein
MRGLGKRMRGLGKRMRGWGNEGTVSADALRLGNTDGVDVAARVNMATIVVGS